MQFERSVMSENKHEHRNLYQYLEDPREYNRKKFQKEKTDGFKKLNNPVAEDFLRLFTATTSDLITGKIENKKITTIIDCKNDTYDLLKIYEILEYIKKSLEKDNKKAHAINAQYFMDVISCLTQLISKLKGFKWGSLNDELCDLFDEKEEFFTNLIETNILGSISNQALNNFKAGITTTLVKKYSDFPYVTLATQEIINFEDLFEKINEKTSINLLSKNLQTELIDLFIAQNNLNLPKLSMEELAVYLYPPVQKKETDEKKSLFAKSFELLKEEFSTNKLMQKISAIFADDTLSDETKTAQVNKIEEEHEAEKKSKKAQLIETSGLDFPKSYEEAQQKENEKTNDEPIELEGSGYFKLKVPSDMEKAAQHFFKKDPDSLIADMGDGLGLDLRVNKNDVLAPIELPLPTPKQIKDAVQSLKPVIAPKELLKSLQIKYEGLKKSSYPFNQESLEKTAKRLGPQLITPENAFDYLDKNDPFSNLAATREDAADRVFKEMDEKEAKAFELKMKENSKKENPKLLSFEEALPKRFSPKTDAEERALIDLDLEELKISLNKKHGEKEALAIFLQIVKERDLAIANEKTKKTNSFEKVMSLFSDATDPHKYQKHHDPEVLKECIDNHGAKKGVTAYFEFLEAVSNPSRVEIPAAPFSFEILDLIKADPKNEQRLTPIPVTPERISRQNGWKDANFKNS